MESQVELIYNPRITLIARPQFLEPAHLPVKWSEPGTDGERLAEFAGRLCYMSQNNPADRTTAGYLKNIFKQGHGSVLEHAVYVVLIEGISRTCSHELVRHRAGFGFSQVSQRYVDSSNVAFVIPPAMIGDPEEVESLARHCMASRDQYEAAVDRLMTKYSAVEDKTLRRKMAREAARSYLPNAAETKIVVSGNARAWRNALELRTGGGADQEIRRMAIMVLEVLAQEAGAFFQDFRIREDEAVAGRLADVEYHKV